MSATSYKTAIGSLISAIRSINSFYLFLEAFEMVLCRTGLAVMVCGYCVRVVAVLLDSFLLSVYEGVMFCALVAFTVKNTFVEVLEKYW